MKLKLQPYVAIAILAILFAAPASASATPGTQSTNAAGVGRPAVPSYSSA